MHARQIETTAPAESPAPRLYDSYRKVRRAHPSLTAHQCMAMARTEYRIAKRGGYSANARVWRSYNVESFGTCRATAKFIRGKGLSPCPVYVARYPNGQELRLSFWSQAGKPLDFAHGYNVALAIGRAAPVAGYVEHAGQRHNDPYFTRANVVALKPRKESAASRLKAICAALNQGEIDAALVLAKGVA